MSAKKSTSTTRAAKARDRFVEHLATKDDILFLTTSNRYAKHKDDVPKSTQLARSIKAHFAKKNIRIVDVPTLKIYTCEGNISAKLGNRCGLKEALLENKRLNPTGYHRCWASFNNKDDELYKITRALFRSKVVVFFGSVRWGQVNSIYQRLYERLSWIENRFSTLGEKPIREIKECEAGVVLFGHNWNGADVLRVQKQNLRWFGFKVPRALSFHWQYTRDANEESVESYVRAAADFQDLVQIIVAPASGSRSGHSGSSDLAGGRQASRVR